MTKKHEMMGELAKDTTTTLAAAAGTVVGGGLPAMATFVGGVLSGEWLGGKIRERERRRAETVLRNLHTPDDEKFTAYLSERLLVEDDEVLAILRHLLLAAVSSPTSAGLAAMARLARAHLTAGIEMWLARGGLGVLAESTDAELNALRQLLESIDRYCTQKAVPAGQINLEVDGGRLHEFNRDRPIDLGTIGDSGSVPRDRSLEVGNAPLLHRRVFRLLKKHALADEATDGMTNVRGLSGADVVAIEVATVRILKEALEFG